MANNIDDVVGAGGELQAVGIKPSPVMSTEGKDKELGKEIISQEEPASPSPTSSSSSGGGFSRAASSSTRRTSSSSGMVKMMMGRNKTMPVTRGEFEALPIPEWKLHCLCSDPALPATIRGQLGGSCF